MNAIKLETTISEEMARALPELRPLLGKRVELIALESEASQLAQALAEGARAKLSSLGIREVDLEDAVRWARAVPGDLARPAGS